MIRYTSYLILIAIVYGGTAASAYAATYRWVDENGVVNYSERKPRGIDESRLTKIGDDEPSRNPSVAPSPQPSALPIAQAADEPQLSPEQQQMLADLEQKESERQTEIAKIREDNCARARRVLDNLSARSRIRVRAADGTQRALPEDERQERIAEAQRGVVENCQT
jgi:hypothetical protein